MMMITFVWRYQLIIGAHTAPTVFDLNLLQLDAFARLQCHAVVLVVNATCAISHHCEFRRGGDQRSEIKQNLY